MFHVAGEIKAVAFAEMLGVAAFQRDIEIAAENVQEFFAFVGVRIAAASAGSYSEEMRLHDGVAPSEKFHAHAGAGFENFSIGGADVARIGFGSVEERKDVDAIVARDAGERGNGGAHLAALEGAEETDGDAGGSGDLRERSVLAEAQLAETRTDGTGLVAAAVLEKPFGAEQVHNRRGVHAAGAAEELCALEQANIARSEKAIAALGASGRNKADTLPGAQRGRRNADKSRDIADA